MRWISIKSVKNVFRVATDAVLDITASVITTTGTIASALGGAGLAVAQIMGRVFGSDYFGSITLNGDVSVRAQITNTQFSIEESFPLSLQGNQHGKAAFSLASLCNPLVLHNLSLWCIGGGVVLNVVGNSLRLRQEYRHDAHFYRKKFETTLAGPTTKDYLCKSLASLSDSAKVVAFSYSIICIVDRATGLFSDSVHFSYPFYSDLRGNSTFYNGPLAYQSYPVQTELISQNFTSQLPKNWMLQVKTNFKGLANVTYGGTLSFKEKKSTVVSPTVTLVVAVIAGASAHVAGSIFARTVRNRNHQRAHDSHFDIPLLSSESGAESDDNAAFVI